MVAKEPGKKLSKYFPPAEGVLEEAAYLSGLTIEVPQRIIFKVM